MKVQKLKLDKKFQACLADDNDEIFPNGFFQFNITKMIEFISQNQDQFSVENIAIETYRKFVSPNLDEETIQKAQTLKPIILAEISPGNYNVIDGNHRLEKAFRDGLKEISAYRLTVDQHQKFLTSIKSYEAYVRYWNQKVDDSKG